MAAGEFCEHCGKELIGKKRGTRFCDDRCRIAHDRKVKSEGLIENKPNNIENKANSKANNIENKANIIGNKTNNKANIIENKANNNENNLEDISMQNDTTGLIEVYKIRYEDLSKLYEDYKLEHKETEKELRDQIKAQESENKTLEKKNNSLNKELEVIKEKHAIELREAGVESSGTLGGFLKDAGKPENLESILGMLTIFKEWRNKPNDQQQQNNPQQQITSGDPEKDQYVNKIVEACQIKDKPWVAKLLIVVDKAMTTPLIENIVKKIAP